MIEMFVHARTPLCGVSGPKNAEAASYTALRRVIAEEAPAFTPVAIILIASY